MRLSQVLLFFLPLALSGATFAIRDVTLIDPGSGQSRPHSTLIVRNDRISATGPAASTVVPNDARLIDGRGKFIIPGLWDMHVHLWYSRNQLPLYVANGVTGVRDMGSDFKRVIEWRRAILQQNAIGPHILTSGPPITGKPSEDSKLPSIVVASPDDARHAVDQLADMGVDFVKVLSNVPHDAYIALAERARQLHVEFAGHVPTSVPAWDVVEARQNSIEHMFGILKILGTDPANPLDTFSSERATAFFNRSALFDVAHVPTLTLWQRMSYVDAAAHMRDPRLKQTPASIRDTWPKFDEEMKDAAKADTPQVRKQLELVWRMVRIMHDSGVVILAGTDTGDPYTAPGGSLHDELALLVNAGLTPMEALQSATTAPAKFLGWDESVGRLEPGFVADIVLLDADPLLDIHNVAKIAGVAVRGRYLDRAAIAAILQSSGRE